MATEVDRDPITGHDQRHTVGEVLEQALHVLLEHEVRGHRRAAERMTGHQSGGRRQRTEGQEPGDQHADEDGPVGPV